MPVPKAAPAPTVQGASNGDSLPCRTHIPPMSEPLKTRVLLASGLASPPRTPGSSPPAWRNVPTPWSRRPHEHYAASLSRCSSRRWHSMHSRVQGTMSSRSNAISRPQLWHRP